MLRSQSDRLWYKRRLPDEELCWVSRFPVQSNLRAGVIFCRRSPNKKSARVSIKGDAVIPIPALFSLVLFSIVFCYAVFNIEVLGIFINPALRGYASTSCKLSQKVCGCDDGNALIASEWQQVTFITGNNMSRLPHNRTFDYFIVLRIASNNFECVVNLN